MENNKVSLKTAPPLVISEYLESLLDKAYEIESNVNQIQIDTVSSIAEHERQFKKQCKGWWNIFDHFFRGVGLLLRIVFGYPIQMIKPDFSFHSKGWNTFSAIVGLIGSVASIISLIIK